MKTARHRGKQAPDGCDLNGDQPKEILAMMGAQRDPALVHHVEPAIHPVKH